MKKSTGFAITLLLWMCLCSCTEKNKPMDNSCCPSANKPHVSLKPRSQNNDLIKATEAGNLELVKKLVAAGADVNSSNNTKESTPLMSAVKWDHKDIVKYLASKGAAVKDDPYLLISCLKGARIEMVRLLLLLGANPNSCCLMDKHPIVYWIEGFSFFYNYCPESEAYNDRQIQILELLIKKGARTNCTNKYGYSFERLLERKFSHPTIMDFSYFMCKEKTLEEGIANQVGHGGVQKKMHPIYKTKKTQILTLLAKYKTKDTN